MIACWVDAKCGWGGGSGWEDDDEELEAATLPVGVALNPIKGLGIGWDIRGGGNGGWFELWLVFGFIDDDDGGGGSGGGWNIMGWIIGCDIIAAAICGLWYIIGWGWCIEFMSGFIMRGVGGRTPCDPIVAPGCAGIGGKGGMWGNGPWIAFFSKNQEQHDLI